MCSKIIVLSAVLAVTSAVLLAEPHYSSAAAVSSQSIVRHDEPQLHGAPVAYHAAPFAYHAAPVAYQAPIAYQTPIAYHAAPAHYSGANSVHYTSPIAKVIAPASKLIVSGHHDEEYAHPQYDFSYSVADGHTGDNKSQHESRNGDAVHGEYSLVEADGSIRKVEYSADDHNGFNAIVSNSAPTHHAAHAPVLLAHH